MQRLQSSFSSVFLAKSLRFIILGEIFAYATVFRFVFFLFFFNPTIEVITFRLRGWCMLGIILLPVFTRLGHERQDFLSVRWNVCVHRLNLGLYPHPKEF